MKKILLLLCFLAAFFVSNAQYPVIQYLGRDSSLVDSRGGLKARLINYPFTDTTEANTQRISQYPGAMIYTTSGGDKLWLRSSDATLWTRVGTTSGGGNGIASLGTSAYGLIIQNDSTYKVDTILLSTKLWRQKGIDSVQSNVNLKLNITDTANIRARLYAGSNVTITGTYPNLTIASTGGGVSDTSVLLVDTLYNRIATVINVDSMRLKSILILHGTDTAAAVATDSTLQVTVPKTDTASLSIRINAKVDTSAVIVFDTTGAVTGYELYIDRTGADTIKTRAATGGGSSGAFAKLEWFSGDENAPATGDSTMVNDSFSAKYLDVYRNGIKQPHIVGDTGWARVNDTTIKVIPYFAADEFWHIEARDSSSYTQLTLQAPSVPSSTTIAYVSSADGGNNSSATASKTFAFNVSSGTDRYLVVGFVGDVSAGADDVSSVTYNGVAMTLLCKTTNPSGGRWNYLYGLANPASGNNNVVITFSSTHWIICGAAEYTGVQGVDVTNTNSTAVSTLTTTSTTTANNTWGIIFAGCGGGAATLDAGSGCTKRTTSSMGYWALFDSNGAVTPAGSHSMTTTYSAGSNVSHTVVYLKPY